MAHSASALLLACFVPFRSLNRRFAVVCGILCVWVTWCEHQELNPLFRHSGVCGTAGAGIVIRTVVRRLFFPREGVQSCGRFGSPSELACRFQVTHDSFSRGEVSDFLLNHLN